MCLSVKSFGGGFGRKKNLQTSGSMWHIKAREGEKRNTSDEMGGRTMTESQQTEQYKYSWGVFIVKCTIFPRMKSVILQKKALQLQNYSSAKI